MGGKSSKTFYERLPEECQVIIEKGHLVAVKILLERFGPERCGLTLVDESQRNVIHILSWKGHLDVLKDLLDNYSLKFDPLEKDSLERTHLTLAVVSSAPYNMYFEKLWS